MFLSPFSVQVTGSHSQFCYSEVPWRLLFTNILKRSLQRKKQYSYTPTSKIKVSSRFQCRWQFDLRWQLPIHCQTDEEIACLQTHRMPQSIIDCVICKRTNEMAELFAFPLHALLKAATSIQQLMLFSGQSFTSWLNSVCVSPFCSPGETSDLCPEACRVSCSRPLWMWSCALWGLGPSGADSSRPAAFHVRKWKRVDKSPMADAPAATDGSVRKLLLALRKVQAASWGCEHEKVTLP